MQAGDHAVALDVLSLTIVYIIVEKSIKSRLFVRQYKIIYKCRLSIGNSSTTKKAPQRNEDRQSAYGSVEFLCIDGLAVTQGTIHVRCNRLWLINYAELLALL